MYKRNDCSSGLCLVCRFCLKFANFNALGCTHKRLGLLLTQNYKWPAAHKRFIKNAGEMNIKMISAAGIINVWLLMNTSALTDDIDALIDSCMFQSIMFVSQDRHHILLYTNENKMGCIGVDQWFSANFQERLSKF